MSVIAIEIGGTKQQIALGSKDGKIDLLRTVKLGNNTNPENIIRWLDNNIRQILNGHSASAVAVGYGGPVDLKTGTVICSMQVDGWQGVHLREHFAKLTSLPCYLINDSDCAGLGELKYGAGRGSKVMLYSNIGTGIGGSILINGSLYTGSGRGSGELGHTRVRDFRSGEQAELEEVCCGPAIEKALNKPSYVPMSSCLFELLVNGTKITCADLGKAAEQGDAFAMEELDKIADCFAQALANAVNLLAPDCIVIGGGLANMGETFIGRIRESLNGYVYPAFREHFRLSTSKLLDKAVIVGALAVAGDAGFCSLAADK